MRKIVLVFIVIGLHFFCEKAMAAETALDVDRTTQGSRDLCILKYVAPESRVIPKVSEVTSEDATTFVIKEQNSVVWDFVLSFLGSSKY